MSLESAIKKFNEKMTDVAEDEFRARCIALANDAIRNTPVDTGRLRANWQATIGSPASGTLPEGASIGVTQARAASVAGQLKAGKAYYLTNNLDYAVPVEEGTEKTRPRRMLARAILNASRKF